MVNLETNTVNVWLFYLINHTRHPLLDGFFSWFYIFGKGWVLIPAFMAVLVFYRECTKTFLLSAAIMELLVGTLKYILDQKRPLSLLNDVYTLSERLYHHSFPSGDTATAFLVLAFFYGRVNRYIRLLLLAYALLIAYGRVYSGVHFPIDVFVGALIGIFSYLLSRKLILRSSSANLLSL
ncbi:phosphatase PAP2 family protein [Thermocrinis minervae]|uniref:PAP2 superfamily protein n=1 Tax=Thermocrinis minervae TaxID=381751 RepID=A0A1M6R410_9AQUI|nr:phosphatase PAP2 family protein [Thermocrinis minervae]SHK27156.1 PAP2 superfamily protein [Thermocrinis minervae]